MSKNIEMNYKTESGYEVVYPKSISDICLSSEELKTLFSLNDESVVDDAFEYVSRQLILMKHNKAGINVTVKSAGGSPLEGVPIPNITANYDGTGEVVTGSDGTAFGYCDAGSVNIAPVNCADVTYTSQNVQTLVGEMYNVEITGIVTNFQKYTSSTSVRFSRNVQSIDINCVGGGGGAGNGYRSDSTRKSGGGGGGGYSTIEESKDFNYGEDYSLKVGSGGSSNDGGISSFLGLQANGGKQGNRATSNGPGTGGIGNGNGAKGAEESRDGNTGQPGYQQGFSSFTELTMMGGGGDSGSTFLSGSGKGKNGQDGIGEGGSSGKVGFGAGDPGRGGRGCVAIRMHLKVTS